MEPRYIRCSSWVSKVVPLISCCDLQHRLYTGALTAQLLKTLVCMQINIEYNISYIYHSLYAFFDRDNIGLPGARLLCNTLVIRRQESLSDLCC